MENLSSQYAEAQMLIRRPVAEVFNAFIDPEITKNFWFTKGSSKLEAGKHVTWEWEMHNVSTTVLVKEIIDNKKITIQPEFPLSLVDFEFMQVGDKATYVVIKNYDFRKSGDELINIIRDATGGYTTVLDGLKAYLEHHLNLNLIADKFPKEVVKKWH